ncbi:hypothetical protein CRUP_030893 [Coryphaenoides rupestris]|nr:hypothetical protein CRUP_030893 [Coryphaenoides rupestris]
MAPEDQELELERDQERDREQEREHVATGQPSGPREPLCVRRKGNVWLRLPSLPPSLPRSFPPDRPSPCLPGVTSQLPHAASSSSSRSSSVRRAPPQLFPHHGRRVCGRDPRPPRVVMATESYIQPVHKPYITLCQGHRLCSTQVSRAATTTLLLLLLLLLLLPSSSTRLPSYPDCCPGWRRLHSHNCNHDVDECSEQRPCAHEQVSRAAPPPFSSSFSSSSSTRLPSYPDCCPGWRRLHSHNCNHDVDECSEQRPCAHECVNTAGSYRWKLDRIESLSEQIGFLEERLGTCKCSPPPLRPGLTL